MNQRLSAAAVFALKEALVNLYWYKRDLYSFLTNVLENRDVIDYTLENETKRVIVGDVVDKLCADQEKYLGDLRRLIREVSMFEDFSHLERVDQGEFKAEQARKAVAALRSLVSQHDKKLAMQKAAAAQRRATNAKQNLSQQIKDLERRFVGLVAMNSRPQQRGYELERLFKDLFDVFDLDPRASFKNLGEQIDGAFTLGNTDYIFEAKWQKHPTQIQDLDAFSSKIGRKLQNTLGLFLSINGFSTYAVQAHAQGARPRMILMTGADLMVVLEQRIPLDHLLILKRQHASQTGNILYEARTILGGG